MKHRLTKILSALALLAIMSGCATQPGRMADGYDPFCTLAGAAVGGGGAAAISLAAGPIGAGVFVGALLGTLACSEGPPPAQPVAAVPMPPSPPPPAPEPDSDGDGVIDRLDRCPGTPRGTRVDAHGCPDILLTLTGINFAFDSSRIDQASERVLAQAVDAMNSARSVKVRIKGHTDSIGTEAYNLRLSERRAEAVRDYLLHQGIHGERMTTEGRGESQPVAPNDSEGGRYQNRRVEFHVVGSGPMTSTDTGTDRLHTTKHHGSKDMSVESWRRLDQTVVYY